MKKTWYQFKSQAADPAVAEIHIVDFIGSWGDEYYGYGVTAKSFVDELSRLPEAVKTIRVHINSPGGDVFAAANIANALRAQRSEKGRTVETIVDGLAASAASVVMMAGEKILIADNGMVMVHNPWTIAVGYASDMRKTADTLDAIRNTIVATYQWHSELSEEQLIALMDAETWMDAAEAIANGFATEVVDGLKAAASIDPRAAAKLKVPERFAAQVSALLEPVAAPPPAPVVEGAAKLEDVLALCESAGLDLVFARALTKDGPTLAQAQARVSAEKDKRTAETARQDGIRSLCDRFKVGGLAADLIAGGTSIEASRSVVAKVTAMVDKVEIDAGLRPDGGAGAKPVIDTNAVYARLNSPRN